MTHAHSVRPTISNPPQRDEVGAIINQTVIAYEGLTAQYRRFLEINAHERLAIAHLWESGPMTMSELGDRIPLSRAAVTSLTDRLERFGYVERTPDTNDRRRTVLSVTSTPADRLEALTGDYQQRIEGLLEKFSDQEFTTVVRFLDGLREVSHASAKLLRDMDDGALEAMGAGDTVTA